MWYACVLCVVCYVCVCVCMHVYMYILCYVCICVCMYVYLGIVCMAFVYDSICCVCKNLRVGLCMCMMYV